MSRKASISKLNAGFVRSKMPEARLQKSDSLALSIFAADLAVYIITFWLIVLAPFWIIKILAIYLNGLFIGALFVIGHDACHGSYASKKWLNQIVGRLALIPTLNAFSAWDVSHNQLHHGFTNLKGPEDVYVPLSKNDYDRLSTWGKIVQRFYRTPVGIVFYYQIEVWLKRMVFPRKSDLKRMSAGMFLFDSLLLVGYIVLQILGLWALTPVLAGYFQVEPQSLIVNFVLAFMLPFGIWIWLYVTVTMLHHTHPQVPWFDKRSEWNFFRSQVEASVHIKPVPGVLRLLTNNVFEHTAHHVDVRIPLYNLKKSQTALHRAFPGAIRLQQGTFLCVFRTLRICKLYDYENHQWLDFKGNVTSRIEGVNLNEFNN